jgi:hypothetical protein
MENVCYFRAFRFHGTNVMKVKLIHRFFKRLEDLKLKLNVSHHTPRRRLGGEGVYILMILDLSFLAPNQNLQHEVHIPKPEASNSIYGRST